MEDGRENGLSASLLDRLRAGRGARSRRSPRDVRDIAALPDPVGEVIEGARLAERARARASVRVPLGVVAVVYEARPNVTIDCSALCLKSGNAIVLRGSSMAAHSNAVLAAGRRARRSRRPGSRRARSRSVAGGDRDELRQLASAGRRRRPGHPARGRGAEGRAARSTPRCR